MWDQRSTPRRRETGGSSSEARRWLLARPTSSLVDMASPTSAFVVHASSQVCSDTYSLIPVGAGPVKSLPGVVIFLFVFSVRFGRAELRRRGQGSAEGRPRSGRRSLTPTPDGACCLRRRKWGGLLLGSMVAGRVRAPARFPGCGQARLGAVGHPFAARWRHGVLRQVRSVGINQMGRPRQGWGS